MHASDSLPLTRPGKLPGLDHLRTLAISLVLLFHYQIFPHPAWLTEVGAFGWTGVDLFFVLSGYLIAAQLLAELGRSGSLALKTYFIKRTFRILPAYLTVLALYFAVPAFREREALPPLWKFLTFTQNFGLDLGAGGTFSHAWSLCVEEQFYLLLPLGLLALGARQAGRWAAALPALALVGLAARWLSWHWALEPLLGRDEFRLAWYKWLYYPTYNRLDGLLVGIGIAALLHFRPQLAARLARFGNGWLLLGGVVLAGAWWLCRDAQAWAASLLGFPVVALGYGLLVLGAIGPGRWLPGAASRVSGRVAELSFGIYLIHKGIIHVVQTAVGGWALAVDGTPMMALCLLCVGLGAWGLRQLVERPFLRLRGRLLRREAAGATVAQV